MATEHSWKMAGPFEGNDNKWGGGEAKTIMCMTTLRWGADTCLQTAPSASITYTKLAH